MTKYITAIKGLSLLAVFAVAVLVANLANAQTGTPATGTPAPSESTKATTPPPTPPAKPIVINWKLHKLDGNVNLTINPDGSSDFSGGFKDKKPYDDWDITIAVKSSTGAVIVYHWEGDAGNGVEFSKTGSSAFIKDEFPSFASKHTWSGAYGFHLTKEGKKKHYEEMEAKRKKLHEEAEEAIKKHDEKVMKQREQEEKQEAQAEARWEENYASQHPSGGGGGGGGSVLSSIGSTVSSAVSSVGSVLGDIGSFF